jgi:hypothetical protein
MKAGDDGAGAAMQEASVKLRDHALDPASFVLLRADQLTASADVVVPAAGFECGHGALILAEAGVDLAAGLDEQLDEMLGLTAIT